MVAPKLVEGFWWRARAFDATAGFAVICCWPRKELLFPRTPHSSRYRAPSSHRPKSVARHAGRVRPECAGDLCKPRRSAWLRRRSQLSFTRPGMRTQGLIASCHGGFIPKGPATPILRRTGHEPRLTFNWIWAPGNRLAATFKLQRVSPDTDGGGLSQSILSSAGGKR